MKRIHIVGVGPRTGTTLLAEMMIACFDIDLHTDHEKRVYAQPDREGRIFLTKHPRELILIGPLLFAMPNLHVICMVRDPRDMVVSKHGKDSSQYWTTLKFWKKYAPYEQQLRWHPRFTGVRYEELVTHPDRIQAQIMRQMPFLEKTAAFSRFHEVAQPSKPSFNALRGVRPVSDASVGRWRQHLPRVAGQLQKHGPITEDLIEFGYETDDTWLEEIKDVLPDLSESHGAEYFTEEDLRRRKRGKYVKAAVMSLQRLGIRGASFRKLYATFRKLYTMLLQLTGKG